MKRWFTLSMLTLLAVILTSTTGLAQYKAGNNYIGVNATVVTEPVGWGLTYEYGYDENIGLGLTARYWSPETTETGESTWTGTLERETFMFLAQALYHALPKSQFDPYGGVRLGYAYYAETWTTEGVAARTAPPEKAESGITMSIVGGMRYFFSPQISAEAALEYFLMHDDGYFVNRASTGMLLGVNFTLM
ncbi:MAG: outer membrane beta-barrel protein, partial [Bacteroidota bacterium]|nr:outer membrane beta-barrel protein [Bacteroidota bacterium]